DKINKKHLERFKKFQPSIKRIIIDKVELNPSTLDGNEKALLKLNFFWGKARSKTLDELTGGKNAMVVSFSFSYLRIKVDYGDDPFETKKWCKYLEKLQFEEKEFETETESCEGDASNLSINKCPIYCDLKKKEKENDKTEVSKKDLWHFSEYFHGNLEDKPICRAKNCPHFNRLANGGYSPRDMRHTLVFRHGIGRVKKEAKLNPIIFIKDESEIIETPKRD
ncbi:MAG: hypothetical protein GY714_32825, partial [Desulfobacterales bacterium]|nr:hypothetical protein [Desulfobacterales bacterium]